MRRSILTSLVQAILSAFKCPVPATLEDPWGMSAEFRLKWDTLAVISDRFATRLLRKRATRITRNILRNQSQHESLEHSTTVHVLMNCKCPH